MKIDAIDIFHVALPLKQPITTRLGPFESLETILVRMRSGDHTGWGEASPGNAPLAGSQWAAGVFGCLRDWLAPAMVGATLDDADAATERLAAVTGNQYAKAALDTAWWDLNARMQGRPLHELLDGKRTAIEIGTTLDQMESIDDFLAAVGGAFEAGFARVRLMMRPGWDIAMVDAVRKEYPVETIHVDVEGQLDLGHVETLQRLDDFGLAMIEQPLPADDLVGHAWLQDSIRTPVGLAESITSVAQTDIALDLQSGKYVNVEPGRVGGLTPAVAIHDACHHKCVPCFVGAMPQSAIGARIGLALAAKPNFTYPADLSPAQQMLKEDLADPLEPVRQEEDGVLRVPLWSEPGLGIDPELKRLEQLTIARAELE